MNQSWQTIRVPVLVVKFQVQHDHCGEERGIESCEAVSASSSFDSHDTFSGSEPVGEGGGKILEAMTQTSMTGEIKGNSSSLSPGNYVITGTSPVAIIMMPIQVIIKWIQVGN